MLQRLCQAHSPHGSQQQKLEASDAAANDALGFSVSISGDTAIVAAFNDTTTAGVGAGSAYVFVRNGTTWTQQQKLEASDKKHNPIQESQNG